MREAAGAPPSDGSGLRAFARRLRAWLGEPESLALTSRERAIAQLRARFQRERRFEPKPAAPEESKQAEVVGYRSFTRIFSQAVCGSAHPDPKGYDLLHPPNMMDSNLGREARAALQASRFILPDDPEWGDVIRFPSDEEVRAIEERYKAIAGVRTRKALFDGAGLVALRLQDGSIEVDALRYAGRGGWEGIPGLEPTTLPESVSDEELGAAINAALELSRSA